MKRTISIVTNNPKTQAAFGQTYEVQCLDDGYLAVLHAVRNKVHKGWQLLTHPMAGSLKPNQTPYKTVVVCEYNGGVHFESLHLIENAIERAGTFLQCSATPNWGDKALEDFQTVDVSFIAGALNNQHEIPKRRYVS